MNRLKMSPLALGLSLGIFWGVSILLFGLMAYFFTFGEVFVNAIGAIYIGYEPTIIGSFIGGIIGFIDAFICGLIIAWLYNLFVK
ncbi:bacteriophage holin [Legionella impletisoli]|uniref:Uncharacterized protein n=1 Tax=Legionella impletisoli TaxID=343510 RepID=A0A917N9X6_9GAMM|nr:bacteriophage holin [Legionella impletisoli]GGI80238.1 hypothetical protein GCM10007966_05920 [Legionella impletisoli]